MQEALQACQGRWILTFLYTIISQLLSIRPERRRINIYSLPETGCYQENSHYSNILENMPLRSLRSARGVMAELTQLIAPWRTGSVDVKCIHISLILSPNLWLLYCAGGCLQLFLPFSILMTEGSKNRLPWSQRQLAYLSELSIFMLGNGWHSTFKSIWILSFFRKGSWATG